jgi:hypothetical protein
MNSRSTTLRRCIELNNGKINAREQWLLDRLPK